MATCSSRALLQLAALCGHCTQIGTATAPALSLSPFDSPPSLSPCAMNRGHLPMRLDTLPPSAIFLLAYLHVGVSPDTVPSPALPPSLPHLCTAHVCKQCNICSVSITQEMFTFFFSYLLGAQRVLFSKSRERRAHSSMLAHTSRKHTKKTFKHTHTTTAHEWPQQTTCSERDEVCALFFFTPFPPRLAPPLPRRTTRIRWPPAQRPPAR